MSNKLKIERVVDGVSVQEGTNYTAYLRNALTKQDLLSCFYSIFGNLRYQQNSDSACSILARDLWQRISNLPHSLGYTSIILTSTECGASGGSVVPSTSFDPGYIGYVNTDVGYSGNDADRGTINLGESVFYSPFRAKLVIDLPTHACNGSIKTLLIGKRPIGTAVNINQSKESVSKHAIAVAPITDGESLYPTMVWYRDWVISYSRINTSNYPSSVDIKYAKISSDSTGYGYTCRLNGASYLTQFDNEIYARVKPETEKMSLDDARQNVVYKKVIVTELGGDLLDIKLSDEEYRPLADIPDITDLSDKTYFFSCIGHLGHLVFYACEGSSLLNNGYINIFNVNADQSFSKLARTSSYCATVPACLRYDGDDLVFTQRPLCTSNSWPGYGYRISSEGVSSNTAPTQYPIKSRSENSEDVEYNYYQVQTANGALKLYGIYVPDEPMLAFELTEPIIKTDKEVVKITLDIDLTIG